MKTKTNLNAATKIEIRLPKGVLVCTLGFLFHNKQYWNNKIYMRDGGQAIRFGWLLRPGTSVRRFPVDAAVEGWSSPTMGTLSEVSAHVGCRDLFLS